MTPEYFDELVVSAPRLTPEQAGRLAQLLPAPVTRLLRMHEVAEQTGIPVETLRTWRKQGRGPKGARFGKRVMYRAADVEAWIDEQFATGS